MVEEAYAGDIIGIPNHGVLRVGDTLSESGADRFTGIPNFAPEILRRVRLEDPMKPKHLARALESLAEEGVTQVFKPDHRLRTGSSAWSARCSSTCSSRLRDEYGLDADLEPSPYETARWLQRSEADIEKFLGVAPRPWRRTATARRCSLPRARGRSATSPKDSRSSHSRRRANATTSTRKAKPPLRDVRAWRPGARARRREGAPRRSPARGQKPAAVENCLPANAPDLQAL